MAGGCKKIIMDFSRDGMASVMPFPVSSVYPVGKAHKVIGNADALQHKAYSVKGCCVCPLSMIECNCRIS